VRGGVERRYRKTYAEAFFHMFGDRLGQYAILLRSVRIVREETLVEDGTKLAHHLVVGLPVEIELIVESDGLDVLCVDLVAWTRLDLVPPLKVGVA
jgi:hypothetical protein